MESKINHNKELSKLKNRKMFFLSLIKLKELKRKKKALESCNFQRSASIIFIKNKFKISNEFDHKGIKNFLKEKFEYLKPMNLDDSLIEIKSNRKQKHDDQKISKKKVSKYQSNLFDSGIPKIPIKNSSDTMNQLFSNNSLCLNDILRNLI